MNEFGKNGLKRVLREIGDLMQVLISPAGSLPSTLAQVLLQTFEQAQRAEMSRRGVTTLEDLAILRLRDEVAPNDFSPNHRVPVTLMTRAERQKQL